MMKLSFLFRQLCNFGNRNVFIQSYKFSTHYKLYLKYNNPLKVVIPQHNFPLKHISTKTQNNKIITLGRVFTFSLVSLLCAGVYIVQDQKRKKHPVVLKIPPPKTRKYKLPEKVPFLIIGGGTSAHAAARAIRADDAENRVLIVGEEGYLPYMRPPLSKELWLTNDPVKVSNLSFLSFSGRTSDLFWEEDGYYCSPEELMDLEHGGTAVALGLKAVKLDTQKQLVCFDDGQQVAYDKCLLATGARPRSMDALKDSSASVKDRVLHLRNIDDFKRLQEVTKHAKSIAVVGNDILASEISCALANKALGENKVKISLVIPEKNVLASLLPEYLGKWSTEQVKKENVSVIGEKKVVGSRYDWLSDQVVLKLHDDSHIKADYIIECAGLEANVDLASGTDIKIDEDLGGFEADEQLKVAANVWAAGAAVSFMDKAYGRRHLEHHNNSFFTGRLAGQNMCGEGKEYWLQQTFWADLGATTAFQAVGLIDASLPTVAVFTDGVERKRRGKEGSKKVDEAKIEGGNVDGEKEDKKRQNELKLFSADEQTQKTSEQPIPPSPIKEQYHKGVVFYLRDSIVVGVLLWNVFNADHTAKTVLLQQTPFSDFTELAKLFKLYDPNGPHD